MNLSSKKTFYVSDVLIKDEHTTISGDTTSVEASVLLKEKEIPALDVMIMDKDGREAPN